MQNNTDIIKVSTMCREVYTPTWAIRNADIYIDGLLRSVNLPNFLCCPAGNWCLNVEMYSLSGYVYLRVTFNKLQENETILLPSSVKAGLVPKTGQASLAAFTLNAQAQPLVFQISPMTDAVLQQKRDQYLVDNKLNILFEIIQCSIKYDYELNDNEDGETMQLPNRSQFARFLEREQFSDIDIIVDNKIIKAHRIILAASSPVFASMLGPNFKEGVEKRVSIERFSEDVVREFLRYLYTGIIPKLTTFAKDLLSLAHYYQVDSLFKMAEKNLCDQLTVNNAAEMISVAQSLEAKVLKTEAKNFIIAKLKEVTRTPKWKELAAKEGPLVSEILEFFGGGVTPAN